nr:hypothetical protein CTI12_AA239000 [Tanacetum cinerariifolium]
MRPAPTQRPEGTSIGNVNQTGIKRCYKCQGLGHYAHECPNKQLVTFVNDSTCEYDTDGDDEVAQQDQHVVYPDQGSLKANLQHMKDLSTTEAEYMTFTEAWKKKIWLKRLLTESKYELRLVAGIAIGALVKGGSLYEVPAQVEKAIEYHEWLLQQEDQPRLTRTPIFSEDAERRLRADYFDDHSGANNDINVLDNSPLFDDLLDDLAPVVSYVVNEVEYRNGYYLAIGIYPEWASFVKSFTVATDPKHTSMQTMWIDQCETQRRKAKELRDRDTHISLQQNLMNHIWREVEESSEED